MRGEGKCPFRMFVAEKCPKNSCEMWDEYEQNCTLTVISINLRKIEGARKE